MLLCFELASQALLTSPSALCRDRAASLLENPSSVRVVISSILLLLFCRSLCFSSSRSWAEDTMDLRFRLESGLGSVMPVRVLCYLSAGADVVGGPLQVSLAGSESEASFSLGETQSHQLGHLLWVQTQIAEQRLHLNTCTHTHNMSVYLPDIKTRKIPQHLILNWSSGTVLHSEHESSALSDIHVT